jgi:hypothetical protein
MNPSHFTRTLAASLLMVAAAATAQAAVIGSVYSTGVDDAGNLLAPGAVDSHYFVSTGAGPFTIGSGGLAASWAPNTAASQWISAAANILAGGGPFFYAINFNLVGLDPGSAQIVLDVSADNQSAVLLNGNAVGTVAFPGWTAFTPLTISTGFQAGLNTLVFSIPNNDTSPDDGPTGLQVRVISATAYAIPEPASAALAGLGLLLAGVSRQRMR